MPISIHPYLVPFFFTSPSKNNKNRHKNKSFKTGSLNPHAHEASLRTHASSSFLPTEQPSGHANKNSNNRRRQQQPSGTNSVPERLSYVCIPLRLHVLTRVSNHLGRLHQFTHIYACVHTCAHIYVNSHTFTRDYTHVRAFTHIHTSLRPHTVGGFQEGFLSRLPGKNGEPNKHTGRSIQDEAHRKKNARRGTLEEANWKKHSRKIALEEARKKKHS